MDAMDFDLDEEDDLSTALGTQSLAARDMVPEGFDNTLRTRRGPEQQKKLTDYEEWRRRARKKLTGGDEFTQYIMGTDGEGTATELTENFNPITWWSTATYPSMRQWAFDTLSCSATLCECERVFLSTKKLITPERNKLQDDTIEALECLKAWFDKGLVEREENVY